MPVLLLKFVQGRLIEMIKPCKISVSAKRMNLQDKSCLAARSSSERQVNAFAFIDTFFILLKEFYLILHLTGYI